MGFPAVPEFLKLAAYLAQGFFPGYILPAGVYAFALLRVGSLQGGGDAGGVVEQRVQSDGAESRSDS